MDAIDFLFKIIWAVTVIVSSSSTTSTDTQKGNFIVSPTDYREFDIFTLKNGLEVLLISDKDADKSGAAMDIGVGSLNDPREYLGLAHFHEHMLFLGSKTYPKQDAFSSYVNMNGGYDNAFTDDTNTNFYFQVDNNSEHLEHSLEIFSRFFIDPLLAKESMNDEMQAVDNEYRKDIPQQGWRDCRMIRYSANPEHPFSKFTIGSIQTLKNNNTVYDAMLAFHDKWVKADIMKLVIYGNQHIHTLKKWAIDKFSTIKSDKSLTKQRPVPAELNNPFRIGIETGKMYRIEPIIEQKKITYLWSISGLNLRTNYRMVVLSMINGLLTSESNNSLYDILARQLLFITSMSSDSFNDDDDEWNGNAISFQLTDLGEKHINEITYYLYQYIDLSLKTVIHRDDIYDLYFQEAKCMDLLYFNHYSLRKQDASLVSELAQRMQYRNSKDLLYLSPDRLIFNQSKIIQALKFMRDPNNVIIHYTNHKFDASIFDAKEPFFGIRFNKEAIGKDLIQRLEHLDLFNNDKKHKLSLPPLNPYILDPISHKCNLNDIKLIDIKKVETRDSPQLIIDEPAMNIWYKPDIKFKSPRINIMLSLISPLIHNEAKNVIYAQLWLSFINFYSSEWIAEVGDASYSFGLKTNRQGLVLSVTALNQKHLSQLITKFIKVYFTNIKHHIFSHYKLSLKVLKNTLISLQKSYKNGAYVSALKQGYNAMYDIVKEPYYDRYSLLEILDELLSFETSKVLNNMLQFADNVISSGFAIEGLIHGNIYKNDALNLISNIFHSSGIRIKKVSTINNNSKWKFQDNLIKSKHLKLVMPNGDDMYRKFVYHGYNTNDKDKNDMVQLWFQFGYNNSFENCKVALLAAMMKTECFQLLRTQEQLGYIVTSDQMTINDVNYLIIEVVSGYKSANHLHERVKYFIEDHYRLFLSQMDETKFKMYVNGLINDLKERDLKLSDETALIWTEIVTHSYDFNWKNKYIEILNKLTLKQMIEFYNEKILGKESKWISMQLYHNKSNAVSHEDDILYLKSTKTLKEKSDAFFLVY